MRFWWWPSKEDIVEYDMPIPEMAFEHEVLERMTQIEKRMTDALSDKILEIAEERGSRVAEMCDVETFLDRGIRFDRSDLV